MKRVIVKELNEEPCETLLVIDATTGQNGMSQAKAFKEATNVTGIVLTKLDGTSKGGIVLAIRHEMGIPIKYVGLGEGVDDLEVFDIEQYLYGLFADFFEEKND
jgi:fused signal recognition particle receptor